MEQRAPLPPPPSPSAACPALLFKSKRAYFPHVGLAGCTPRARRVPDNVPICSEQCLCVQVNPSACGVAALGHVVTLLLEAVATDRARAVQQGQGGCPVARWQCCQEWHENAPLTAPLLVRVYEVELNHTLLTVALNPLPGCLDACLTSCTRTRMPLTCLPIWLV